MVLVNLPNVIWYAELLGHITQVVVIAHNAGYLDVPFAGIVTRQQVVKAMAHLANEYCHARLDVVEIQVERHLVTRRVQRLEIVLQLFARYDEAVKLPLKPHEEHAVLPVDILVKVDDVSVVVRYELRYLRYNPPLVGTMKQQYSRWFHLP